MTDAETAPWPMREDLLARLVDVHVHPHDTPRFRDEFDATGQVRCAKIAVMSSNLHNQGTTDELLAAFPDKVVPAWGIHPWPCHALSTAPAASMPSKRDHYASLFPDQPIADELFDALPSPVALETFISALDQRLEAHDGSMLGEVGLDRSFRIPTTGGHIAPHSMPPLEDGQERFITYSELKTPIAHQLAVLEAQLDVAVRRRRNASVHCVAAQGALVTLLAKMQKKHRADWSAINVDLHSYGGSAEVIRDLQKRHKNVFFSFSTTINARLHRLPSLIQAVDEDRLLVESDCASAVGSSEALWDITGVVARTRGWTAEHAVQVLERNWRRFARLL